MSITVYGNIEALKEQYKKFKDANQGIKYINNKTQQDTVSVGIESYLNRKTKASTLRSYLDARGGKFDRGLWQPPLVAELPNGDRKLFDGDHRRALWRLAYPEEDEMPAQIVPVEDESEISRLFVAINKTARKSLHANEIFVHKYLGGDEEAEKTADHLGKCKLKVSLGTGEVGSMVGDPCDPEINVSGFERAIMKSSAVTVRESSKTIQKLWPDVKSIQVELLGGLAKVYKNNKKVPSHYAKTFEDFLKARKAADVSQREVAASFKIKGGHIVNHSETCIALGILKKYRQWATVNKKMSGKTFTKYYSELQQTFEKELKNLNKNKNR